MSSWVNRHLPRRRDLHQIPEGLRPAPPIPRAERTEVLLSESYQQNMVSLQDDGHPFFSSSVSQNPVYYPAIPSHSKSTSVKGATSELAPLLSTL